jgi:hypothetical protein
VSAQVVNHRNKGRWFQLTLNGKQLMQIGPNFDEKCWDDGKALAIKLANGFVTGAMDKQSMMAAKQAWLEGKVSECAQKKGGAKAKAKPKSSLTQGKSAATGKRNASKGNASAACPAAGADDEPPDEPSAKRKPKLLDGEPKRKGKIKNKATDQTDAGDGGDDNDGKESSESKEASDKKSDSVDKSENEGNDAIDEEKTCDDEDAEPEPVLKARPAAVRMKGKPAAAPAKSPRAPRGAPRSDSPGSSAFEAPAATSESAQSHAMPTASPRAHAKQHPMQTGTGPNGSPRFRPPPMPDIGLFSPF